MRSAVTWFKETKTATGVYNRTYHWLIDKSVDDTRIEIAEGGTATFNYSVKVTPNGYTDSGWTMDGTITVSNPNDWEDITADVTDAFDGGVCTVTDGEDVVIPAGESVTLNYSCSFASQPIYTGTNTATATWDAATYFTPSGTTSGQANTNLTLKDETNRKITVVDDKTDPLNPVTLGTSDYYAGPFVFTYSLDKQGVAGTCTDYTNTAVIDETEQSDSQTVTVCVGKDLTVTKTATASLDRTYNWLIDTNVWLHFFPDRSTYADAVASAITVQGSTVYDPVSRGASTLVRVKNGQTVVIGGMLASRPRAR